MSERTAPTRFNEEKATYAVRGGGDVTDLAAGVAAIRNVVKTLPARPGVYRMLDARGDVLYVGKARALKNRVTNYTQVDRLPKRLQADFSRYVQALADKAGRELNADDIWRLFERTYLAGNWDRLTLQAYDETRAPNGDRIFAGSIAEGGAVKSVSGRGNGVISSVLAGIRDGFGIDLEVADYVEHAIGHGTDVQAAAYVECRSGNGATVWGVGIDEDVATASVRAVLSAANRAGS